MELLETQDPEKKRLIETSNRHKYELEKEIQSISERTQNTITNALLIGGALALTYFTVSQLTGSKKKKKKKAKAALADESAYEGESNEPTFLTQIGEKIITQATVILIDIAREKLADYLQSKRSEVPEETNRTLTTSK
jgi:hypothetical protein